MKRCKVCGKVRAESYFNIGFKQVYICEWCANSITMQQVQWMIGVIGSHKTSELAERPANVTQQRQPKTVSLCVGCKSEDCSQRSEVGGVVTVCAMRQG